MILQGRNILITTNGKSPVIAASKSCEISIDIDEVEVSSPTSGTWKEWDTKRKEWSVSLSHLVTAGQFPRCLTMAGQIVTMKIGVAQPNGTEAPFAGVYAGAISQITTQAANEVYYHPTQKCFVGYVQAEDKYYKYWLQGEDYIYPSTATPYTYDGSVYMWAGDEGLIKLERLTGNAILKSAKVTGSLGNLASGSWTFRGNGELGIEYVSAQ